MFTDDVLMQFPGMKKPAGFTIYPFDKNDTCFTLQSDHRFIQIDCETGKARISAHKKNAYSIHLQKLLGGYEITVTPEQLTEIKLTVLSKGKKLDLHGCGFADNSGTIKF